MPLPTIELQREYQRKYLAKERANAVQEFGGKCVKCGSIDRLEFDHVDRSLKKFNIGGLWSGRHGIRKEELKKCQLLCYECHKRKTAAESTKPLVHGTVSGYTKGCRCVECKRVQVLRIYAWRKKVGGRKAPNRK